MSQNTNSSAYIVPFHINGEQYHPEKTFEVVSPVTGKPVHLCGNATVADAEAAVKAAAEAFPSWRRTTPSQRRNIFLKAADIMERRRDELIQYNVSETGATDQWGEFNIAGAIDSIRDIAGRITTLAGTFPATQNPDVSAIIMREPYGVILSIAPWNAAFLLGLRSIAGPIAAGNTVVLKGTELAPRCMWAVASVFEEAGLPKGVINTISSDSSNAAAVTSALIANPHVRKINFTGSTNVGRIIGKLAGENLKPCVLELGGKAPAIVWEDADLDIAADQCALGAFLNSGQICMSTERIIVHKAIKDQFKEKFKASIEKIFPSSQPAPVLVTSAGVVKNKKLISDATTKGASILYGDINTEEASAAMMRPIVLDGVTKDMEIYQIESFGPTVSLIEIETEEQATEIANDTEYGLSSAVFTEDLRRGLRLAQGIESGSVHINNMTVHDEASLPHGGAKASGFGRFNTDSGLQEWVWTKNVTFRN